MFSEAARSASKIGRVRANIGALWLLGMTGLFLSYYVHAQEVYMEAGESQVIQVDGNIDTIFISAPKVADYEIIGERGVMVYAKSDGQTDLIAFDKMVTSSLKLRWWLIPF